MYSMRIYCINKQEISRFMNIFITFISYLQTENLQREKATPILQLL